MFLNSSSHLRNIWGLAKDLLVPFREQKIKMESGQNQLVYIYVDHESDRIAASAKLDKFLDNVPPEYDQYQEVDLIIYHQTDMGYRAIINNLHTGMLYESEIFKTLKPGDKMKGYITKVREDEKIDLSLQKSGMGDVGELGKVILNKLKQNNGFIAINDKSSPEMVYSSLGVSKKLFKKALGGLYKKRLIEFKDDGTKLLD